MNRRDALTAAAALLGGAALASAGALAACAPERREAASGMLDADDRALAEAVADTLLPDTPASPGARAAGAGAAMNLLLTDCYEPAAQRRVVQGLDELRARCRDRCGGEFASLAPAERARVLREVDAEARRAGDGHWFPVVRELAERAYFSSEIGTTRALRWVRVPGRWEGCVPLRPGQPAWA